MKKGVLYILTLIIVMGITNIVTAQRVSISPAIVKTGQLLELALPYTLEQFINFYVEFGKQHTDKKYGTLYINQVYKDEQFTYFIRGTDHFALSFIKVQNSELAKTDYTVLDGDSIRKKFIDEIVPEKDKQKGNIDNKCMTAYISATFHYQFIESNNQIEIQYKWKVKCEMVSTLINKTYAARYNISTQSFEVQSK
jgi:hypothetical protein